MADDIATLKFLIETLSSIKSSLDSIEKDTSRKASNIQTISEQLVIIIDALRRTNETNLHAHDLIGQKLEALVRAIDELKGRMDVSETRIDYLSELVTTILTMAGDINMRTEVSAESIDNMKKDVGATKDMVINMSARHELEEDKKEKKPSLFSNIIDFLKNLDNLYKSVLAIVLLITLIVAAFLKNGVAEAIASFLVKGGF